MTVFLEIAKQYGLFVALVVYVLWEYKQREKRLSKESKSREDRILKENKEREAKYIEREEKYIGIVQTLSEEVKDRLSKIEYTLRRK